MNASKTWLVSKEGFHLNTNIVYSETYANINSLNMPTSVLLLVPRAYVKEFVSGRLLVGQCMLYKLPSFPRCMFYAWLVKPLALSLPHCAQYF